MRTDVTRLDLVGRRRAVLGYSVGAALYAFVIVALYPSFEHSTGLDNLTKNSPTIAALLGAVGSITSPAGWLSVNLYANFFPLLVLLATIGYGASSLAGQDEEGTLATVVTLPIRRRRITVEKAVAMGAQAAAIVVVTTAVLALGHFFDITVSAAHLWGSSLGVLLLGIDLGLVALAVGAATGRRGTALGVASGLAAASYLISSLAPVVAWIRPARFALALLLVGRRQPVELRAQRGRVGCARRRRPRLRRPRDRRLRAPGPALSRAGGHRSQRTEAAFRRVRKCCRLRQSPPVLWVPALVRLQLVVPSSRRAITIWDGTPKRTSISTCVRSQSDPVMSIVELDRSAATEQWRPASGDRIPARGNDPGDWCRAMSQRDHSEDPAGGEQAPCLGH